MAGQLFPMAGPPVVITKPEMVIGRAAGCDIVINAKFISSRHCVLKFDGQTWYVKDLGSTNGTETKDHSAEELTALPSGSTLILARRLRCVIEYIPAVEKARFCGGDAGESVLEAVNDTRGWAEHGPATARLSSRIDALRAKKEA